MRFIVAILIFAFGYAVLYYGLYFVWQYIPDAPSQTDGIPLSVLLGKIPDPQPASIPSNGPSSAQGFDPSIYAHPPFTW